MHANPSLTIRPGRTGDAPLVLEFIRELAVYERLSHEVVATEADIERWVFGDPPFAEVLLAEWDGDPAGFALFFPNFSTFLATPGLYLEDLFVRPEFRGRGIGLALLARLARLAVDRGFKRLDWWVLHWNEPAIRFYQGIGARAMGDWLPYRLDGEALTALAENST
jgi:GNAT superfamily N-acetyltransferase